MVMLELKIPMPVTHLVLLQFKFAQTAGAFGAAGPIQPVFILNL